MSEIKAAIRDSKTGKIYTGESHSHILDDMEDVNKEVFERLRKTYTATGRLGTADNVGFVGPDGKLLNRSQSLKEFGVYNSNDIGRKKNGYK